METTEHIVESYIRYKKGWFTNANIKASGGKEIDIIAVDAHGGKYHIECGVSHKKNFALKAKPTKDIFSYEQKKTKNVKKWRNRNYVDFFIKNKFNDKRVIGKLKEFGFDKNYKKIIVAWQVADDSVHEYAKSKGIAIWELKDKIRDFELGETYYSDDILRTLQLIHKSNDEQMKKALQTLKIEIKDKKTMKAIKEALASLH